MKNVRIFGAVAVLAILLSACTASQPANGVSAKQSGDTIIYVNHPISLSDLIARLPGVRVDDFGPTINVYVRGGAPLFVMDGVNLGRDFNSLQRTVDVNNISAVELLTDPTETMIYSGGSANGVIVIHTGPIELGEN